MYNGVIDVLREHKVGFLPQQVLDKSKLGILLVTAITDALWYLDLQYDKFAARSIHLPPKIFSRLTNFRDIRRQHKKVPDMKVTELDDILNKLGNILMSPWFMNKQFKIIKEAVSELHDGIDKFTKNLKKQQQRTEAWHHSQEPVRSFQDHWGLEEIAADTEMQSKMKDQYKTVYETLNKFGYYKPLCLQEYEPKVKRDRRKWYAELKMPYPIAKFTYSFGNFLGILVVIWKLPTKAEDRDKNLDIKIINDIHAEIPIYSTRAMRKDFLDVYTNTKIKPAVLRSMYEVLTGYHSPATNSCQSEVDERVVEFLLNSDDTQLVWDLRKKGGNHKDTSFDSFWDELKKLLDEETATHERRHSQLTYLPFAVSVADLREKVLSRLPDGTPAPTESWIRLQFYPSNPYTKAAVYYSGKFDVRYKVQQRLLRSQHMDSGYGLCIFRYLKHMAVRFRDQVLFQCLDDKAIVPVGETGSPVSTGVRARHRSLVAPGQPLEALDHDYHVAGIIPSVCFLIDIPPNARDSFYTGTVHVTIKDKIFEASSPLRHAVETTSITRESCSTDGINAMKPILLRYTDGGPDHRTTYRSVQLVAILEFIALDLDMMILARTAPNQSYNNPAERVMSLLNLGLQNVSLSRDTSLMSEALQARLHSLNTLKATRVAAERNPALKDGLVESMKEPITAVKKVFSRLKWTQNQVQVHDAATADDIKQLLELFNLIDPDLSTHNFPQGFEAGKSTQLDDFVKRHCHQRHYTFQV